MVCWEENPVCFPLKKLQKTPFLLPTCFLSRYDRWLQTIWLLHERTLLPIFSPHISLEWAWLCTWESANIWCPYCFSCMDGLMCVVGWCWISKKRRTKSVSGNKAAIKVFWSYCMGVWFMGWCCSPRAAAIMGELLGRLCVKGKMFSNDARRCNKACWKLCVGEKKKHHKHSVITLFMFVLSPQPRSIGISGDGRARRASVHVGWLHDPF